MIAASYGTVSDIEITWTLIALVGLGVSGLGLRDALADARWLRGASVNGLRRTMARQRIRHEFARVIVQGVFATIGILAATLPQPADELQQPLKAVLIGAVIRWGLIGCGALLVAQSILDRRDRVVLRDIARDRERRVGDVRDPRSVGDERDPRAPGDPRDPRSASDPRDPS